MFKRLSTVLGRLSGFARLKPVSKDDSQKPVAETFNTLWAVCMNEQKRSCVVLNMEPIGLLFWQMENGLHDVKGFNTESEAREFERKCVDALLRLELANQSANYMVLRKLIEHAERIGLEIRPEIAFRIDEYYRVSLRGRLSPPKDDPEQPGRIASRRDIATVLVLRGSDRQAERDAGGFTR